MPITLEAQLVRPLDRSEVTAGTPWLAIVFVAPSWAFSECDQIIKGALSRGAAVYAVPVGRDGDTSDVDDETLAAIDAAVGHANKDDPARPLALIGHWSVAAAVVAFATSRAGALADVRIARPREAAKKRI